MLANLMAERELRTLLESTEGKQDLAQAFVGAEMMVAPWITRDQNSVEVILDCISTATGVRLVPRVEAAGTLGELDELATTLALRLRQAFPRVVGEVLDYSDPPRAYCDLTEAQGVRVFFECVGFWEKEKDLGGLVVKDRKEVGEGVFRNFEAQYSEIDVLPKPPADEQEGEPQLPEIEQGYKVIVK